MDLLDAVFYILAIALAVLPPQLLFVKFVAGGNTHSAEVKPADHLRFQFIVSNTGCCCVPKNGLRRCATPSLLPLRLMRITIMMKTTIELPITHFIISAP